MEGDVDVDEEANRKDCHEEQGDSVYSGKRLYPGGIPKPSLFKDHEFRIQGGTCLRMAYGSPRYSEDLDFNSALDENEAYSALETAAKELEYFGIRAEVRNKRMSRSGFGFTLSYRGPLYEGRDITKGLVRIDVSLRGEVVSEDRITVRTEYDDVKTFVIGAASLDHIFAEKVRALLVRGKARDLYDLWLLMERGIKPELEKNWIKDLKPLLGAVVCCCSEEGC